MTQAVWKKRRRKNLLLNKQLNKTDRKSKNMNVNLLEDQLAAAKAECDRLKQVKESYQERALTANNERARLRAEVERLNGCCEELHAVIDNHGYPSGIDYAEMKSRTEKAEADTARLDWLANPDSPLTRLCLYPSYGWANRVDNKKPSVSERLREGIDAIMKEESSK